jgi:ubiquinone/menaquinone biosynthesis C-methylase UbiE
MSATHEAPHPSPASFWEAVNGFHKTAAIKAAIELDIFRAVGEGAGTAAEIARRAGAAERGVRILCDYLAIDGFLTKSDGRYGLSVDAAAFLDPRSPTCIATAVEFLGSSYLKGAFDHLTESVRKGGAAIPEGDTVSFENPIWIKFAEGMAPLAYLTAKQVASMIEAEGIRPRKVLDIAAGHGMYGIAVAQQNAAAEVVAVDWGAVLAVAKRNAAKFGVAARYKTIPGSAFEVDFGGGYDLALIPNFLHHFTAEVNEKFLKKVHAALAGGGRAVVVEFVPNDDRVTPPDAAAFSLIMLGTTETGDAYTAAEYRKMFGAAGFSRVEARAIVPSPETAIFAEK